MTDPLREPGFLTAHQFRVVEAERNFFLVACPGSGKTRAGAVRFARLTSDGERVAATSYTNVGVEQIRAVVSRDLGIVVGAESFVGTLHRMLLRFAFYPFGHIVMGCARRPRVVQEESAVWQDVVFGDNRIRASTARFSFRPDGDVRYRRSLPRGIGTREDAERLGGEQAIRLKARAAANGFASPDDAMYWSLCVLQEVPGVADAVASRFEELQIDEAQDTSELQLACVRVLCDTGKLASLVLIGDLEQSIYSFQGASPTGCEELAAARALKRIELSENHRSSQKICDIVVHFCTREAPDSAVGPSADCEWEPEVVLYPAGRVSEVLGWFEHRLQELGLEPANAAVLGRANDLVTEINGASPVDVAPRLAAIGRAVAVVRLGGTLTRQGAEAVDRVVSTASWDIDNLAGLDTVQRDLVREASGKLIGRVPELQGDLREWARAVARALAETAGELVEAPARQAGHLIRAEARYAGVDASGGFPIVGGGLQAQTVHDLKGESRDAVLVVAGRSAGGRHTPQGVLWSMPLTGEEIPDEDAEELRIAFVALTRAARFCAVALPDDTGPGIVQAFLEHGFRRSAKEEAPLTHLEEGPR